MFMMCRISFGILFHSLGAMLEKALSPYVFVRDLGSSNSLFETERNDLESSSSSPFPFEGNWALSVM